MNPIKRFFIFIFPLLFLGGVMGGRAQSGFTTLYNFSAPDATGTTNTDGWVPNSSLVSVGGRLYGTTIIGGMFGHGTLFGINSNGSGFTNLHNFTAGSDGDRPSGGLISFGTTLFGTAQQGGSAANGKVFAINADGSGFTSFYSFTTSLFVQSTFVSTNADGAGPLCTPVLSGNTLYGSANGGGIFGHGTIFSVNTNGGSFSNLHNFSPVSGVKATNSDGVGPYGALVLSGGTLYGTTYQGGTNGRGTVFRVNTNGTAFTNLHNFTGFPTDGGTPEGGLVISGNTLYGTTPFGGSADNGTVFAVNTDGSGFTNLHVFQAFSHGTNSDGANPRSTLIISGGTIYGTATAGGAIGNGTIFSLSTNGTAFVNLYNFSSLDPVNNQTNTDGSGPFAGVTLSGSNLYGDAQTGGASGSGTIFSLSLPAPPPLLSISRVGTKVVLSWPTASPNFGLQISSNVTSGIWGDITNNIFTAGTNFVSTNSISNAAAFFRLKGQ